MNTPDAPAPSAETLMIDDLARRNAQTAIEASEWRARALLAEGALEEIKQATTKPEDTEEEAAE